MYGVSGIPHTEWNGHDSHVGGASGGNWESLYPGYLELVQGFGIQETPWRIGISGEYEPGVENVSFAVEVLLDNIDSTVNIDNLYLEIFVVEDNIYSYWGTVDQWHNARNVARKYITKGGEQKFPITISESGQSEVFYSEFNLEDAWEHSNIKIIALVQRLNDCCESPVYQVQTNSILDLDPDPDADGLTYLYDNCHYVYNPDQLDSDNDEMGNACDPCNGLVNTMGNVNLDAFGNDYVPIIGVGDILSLSDLLEGEGLPPNDCQSIDLLEDGEINQWDLLVLVDMVMAGE